MVETFMDYAPTIGLLFFFSIFIGIVVTTMRPNKKKTLEILAHIPLQEEN